MGMNVVISSFSQIGNNKCYRCDEKYHSFVTQKNWKIFDSTRKTIPLRDVLYENTELFVYEEDETYYGIPTGKQYVDNNGDIVFTIDVTKESHPDRLKYKAGKDKILISSIRLARAPALHFENIDFDKYVFSNGFYSLSVKNGWHIRYVLYLLRTQQIKDTLDNSIYGGIGISSYKLDDLFKLQVPVLSYPEQETFLDNIKYIETDITKLKKQKQSITETINRIFGDFFNYDYETFNKLKKINVFNTHYSNYGENKDLRAGVRFHRKSGEFVYKELTSRPYKPIKRCLDLFMITGQGISPKDYDDNGEYAYISMADISTWELNTENIKFVSNQYAKEHLTKKPTGYSEEVSTTTQINDIVMMRSGEGGIGKVAIVKNDIKAIFCDFLIRMRFNQNIINPDFAYYYFRTDYFQYLVECHKKGLGNNTNIFPNQLQNFPIPDISLKEQQKIVDMINEELDKQKAIDKKIEALQQKISNNLLQTFSS